MQWYEAFILIGTVLLGGYLGLYFSRLQNTAWPRWVLSFGGAYLLGLTFISLIPTVYHDHDHGIGVWVLAGFLVQLVLERFSQGIEHGHIHNHAHSESTWIPVMIGIGLHAFFEGVPIHDGGIMHGHTHDQYFWGIVVHKLPAAFALSIIFTYSGLKRRMIYLLLLIFSLLTPAGALVAESLHLSAHFQRITLAMVIGLFLHIATTILFEVEQGKDHHYISWGRVVAILLGLIVVILVN